MAESARRAWEGVGCRRRRYGRWRLCVLGGSAGNGGVHVLLLRRRHRRDRRRTCRAGRGAGVSPPAFVRPAAAIGRVGLPPASEWPATALRVGGGGGQGRRARASAPPPALARPAEDLSGGEGRWCVAAAVGMAGGGDWASRAAAGFGMAGGGSACWRGRRTRETCTCFCSAAGVGRTGGGPVRRRWALVCRRRRPCCRRRRLGKASCRRRWQDRRRTCPAEMGAGVSPPPSVLPAAALGQGELPPASVWPAAALRVGGGGRQGRRARASAPPPALARPAADVSGGEGRSCVSAGVGMAGGGSACCRGRRERETCASFCPAAGVDKTGGGRVWWGGALVCRRRCWYGRQRHVASGVAGKEGGKL